jgi:light-regulated signal transduction histidine kinase (bacteriophytochrome)
MQDAAQGMQTLIQDLLAYSRTNTTEIKFEKTNFNQIIDEVKDDLKEELNEKNAILEVFELPMINIIPFQFRQVMHNLIGNAIKFSKPLQPPHIIIKSEIALGMTFNN